MAVREARADAATLLARTGILGDEAVARAAVDAAGHALAPFAEEAARTAIRWAAERWPDFTRQTVLPTLSDAVDDGTDAGGASGDADPAATPERDALRGTRYVAVALATLAAARVWYRR